MSRLERNSGPYSVFPGQTKVHSPRSSSSSSRQPRSWARSTSPTIKRVVTHRGMNESANPWISNRRHSQSMQRFLPRNSRCRRRSDGEVAVSARSVSSRRLGRCNALYAMGLVVCEFLMISLMLFYFSTCWAKGGFVECKSGVSILSKFEMVRECVELPRFAIQLT